MGHSIRLALLAIIFFSVVLAVPARGGQELPWEREILLREAAKSVSIENTLAPKDPLPDWNSWPQGTTMTITNLKMRTTLWGPPDRITVSLTKNNVWDRRIVPRCLEAPTLQEIIDAAYSPANKGFEGKHPVSQRPWAYGYLLPEGAFYDPYRQPIEYPMPCLKPVGQIILGMDPLVGAAAPQAIQNCANGVVKLQVIKRDAKASLQYVLGMTSNLYAVRGEFSGIDSPIWLRLYRHRDTAHLKYMSEDGKTYTRVGTAGDKAFNFPMDPPTSGKEGRYFWIRQQMPAEKTFPQGFEYVLMGIVITPGKVDIETVEGKTGLGTPHNEARISAAPGAAATATFTPGANGKLEALVTIATTMDGTDVMAVARKRLAEAEAGGFDGVVQENTRWWNAFYDLRENGRIFKGLSGTQCTENILSIYRSYADGHGGGTKTDMRHYECSAGYVLPERDIHPWSSAPCYNEPFTTDWFVRNRADNQDMWKQLVWHWMPGAKDNAKNMFRMPGMCFVHGYQPPIKPDKFYHTTITLEFCLDTMAQTIKPAWDEWDYGGDIEVLRKECYPLMREMAIFYAAYARKGDDGYYHIIPSMEPERWGWYAEFARNKDVISSLCMFRWALNRTAEASEILGVDADLRDQWRQIADNLAPYPTWNTPEGPVFCAIQGVEPKQVAGDHFMEAAHYPTVLADEINLDSPKELKDMMLRTARVLPNAGTARQALTLLGVVTEQRRDYNAEALLNSRSGRLHLFPAVPPDAELAFHHFQARGGFLVSAAKNAQGVYFLEVQPRRDHTCRIMNPWPGRPVVVREAGKTEPVAVQIDKSNGECLVFAAMAGKRYSIAARASGRKTAFGDPDKIDVLVVTGGHHFDREPFLALFKDCDDIRYAEHQLKDESEVFEDVSQWGYDVVMLYNMTQKISPKRQENFVRLLKDQGVGVVVLHHAEAAFQSWHEFHRILGTAYIYFDVAIDGKLWPHCKCKGNQEIAVSIRDGQHPITRGLKNFRIRDETYRGRWWADGNHLLLTTDHPDNDEPVAWTRQYGRSRVFNIQFGHDKQAYACPEYRDLIVRGVRWTAGTLQ